MSTRQDEPGGRHKSIESIMADLAHQVGSNAQATGSLVDAVGKMDARMGAELAAVRSEIREMKDGRLWQLEIACTGYKTTIEHLQSDLTDLIDKRDEDAKTRADEAKQREQEKAINERADKNFRRDFTIALVVAFIGIVGAFIVAVMT